MESVRGLFRRPPTRSSTRAPARPGLAGARLGVALLVTLGCTERAPTPPAAPLASAADAAPNAARVPTPQSSGVLELCKQAAAGVAVGDVFTFPVTLGGVTRRVAVAAGSCVRLEVPRESAPLSKGHYTNTPTAVAALVPATVTLRVDAADLSSAQLQAILDAAPDVSASSSLLLNLIQQLIASDLNVLRGVQASPAVTQAMLDANAGIQITVGAQITVATALTTSQLSALVATLSAFNEGKTKPPSTPSAVDIQIAEILRSYIELTAITCTPVARCSGADLATAAVTATVESGATTTVTFTNRSQPVLRVCKVAGTGIAAGTVFTFGAGGIGVTDAASLTVAAGSCSDAVLLEGTYQVAETGPTAGIRVASISCDPAVQCSNINTSVRVVNAAVVPGITTVTFTNRSALGTLRVCKVAGPGIAAGAEFTMSAGGVNLTGGPGEPVTAGYTVPAGACREATVLEGTYDLAEPSPGTGVRVSDITCDPAARCPDISISVGDVKAQVVGASTTTVTFTNRSVLGTLRVCKVAGVGIIAGRVFTFGAGGINLAGAPGEPATASLAVPAGECREATVLEGNYEVAEPNPGPGVAVSAINCDPSARCSDASLTVGAVHAQIVGATTTTVTFTNRSTLGTLRVCKLAGVGIVPGTVFGFGAGGINLAGKPGEPVTASLSVPAGECRDATLLEGLYDVAEPSVPDGVSVTAITCVPAERCPDISLTVRALHAIIVGGSVTQVTFTNSVTTGLSTGRADAWLAASPPETEGLRGVADRSASMQAVDLPASGSRQIRNAKERNGAHTRDRWDALHRTRTGGAVAGP